MSQETEPAEEPMVPSVRPDPALADNPNFQVPEAQQQLFQPPAGGETFAQQRARMERQTALLFKPPQSYGPDRPQEPRATPYSGKPLSSDDAANATIDVDIIKELGLPTGWLAEKGMLSMDTIKDEWKLEGNYLTRKHYVPRNTDYKLDEETCPLPLKLLHEGPLHQDGITPGPRQMDATFKEQEAQHRLLLDRLHKVQALPCVEKGGKTSLPGEE